MLRSSGAAIESCWSSPQSQGFSGSRTQARGSGRCCKHCILLDTVADSCSKQWQTADQCQFKYCHTRNASMLIRSVWFCFVFPFLMVFLAKILNSVKCTTSLTTFWIYQMWKTVNALFVRIYFSQMSHQNLPLAPAGRWQHDPPCPQWLVAPQSGWIQQ